MSRNRHRPRKLVALCTLFLLLGVYLFFRQDPMTLPFTHSATERVPIVLYEERRTLAPGSWQPISVYIPFRGVLEIDLRVARGNPIDAIFIDGNQLDLLRNNGWTSVKGDLRFAASRTRGSQRIAEIAGGDHYLVCRDASLGVLSRLETDITLKIVLNPE